MPAGSSASTPDGGGHAPRHYRTVLFYGEDGFARIRAGHVTVFGLGGVGGHAALNLARSGIGRLTIVDFDTVSESSLNRSAFAGPADVGRPKTEVLAEHLARVCPDVEVRPVAAFCADESLPDLLPLEGPDRPDLVIDAIDSLNPKVGLLVWCREHGLPVIASMGAAGKGDVAAVCTGDLFLSTGCALARHVRARLRRRGVRDGIPAVWSVEVGDEVRHGAAKEIGDEAPAPQERGRVRNTLASQMSIPGVFGYALASLALDHLAGRSAR
ncbi:MAG TPA: tRNA threonylcarbamoyladenosine dehydratase [Candidatus Krumholzibacteria bacterium]|nr:tRNA threonylcarbamoyladenosine dehydratase [Candidatus Krumholzibacteria bacterium]